VNEQQLDLPVLIKESARGNRETFRVLFEHLQDRLFRYSLSRVTSREDALDVVQESFVDLWRALSRFRYRSEEEFYGFVFTIVKRRLVKYYRARRNSVPLDDTFIDENFFLPREDYRYLNQWITHLKPVHQEILRLRYWSDLSFKDIAVTLAMSEGAAKVSHHRALKKLTFFAQQHESYSRRTTETFTD